MRAVFAERAASLADPAPPDAVAAALVAIFEEGGEARILLIRRALGLPLSPGEMAFPGGKVEVGESLVAAALREAEEEVGLPPDAVEVVGWLDVVTGGVSGQTVLPVVGVLTARPALVLAPAEVAAVADVAVPALGACCRTEWWGDREMFFFELGEDVVWGLTARVLAQLLALLSERTAPPGSAPAAAPAGTSPPGPS